jgi:hypothetical protein
MRFVVFLGMDFDNLSSCMSNRVNVFGLPVTLGTCYATRLSANQIYL